MGMKKAIIECDKCHKEFEEKSSCFATIFINTNGVATERCDICDKCWSEAFNHTTDQQKGGVE